MKTILIGFVFVLLGISSNAYLEAVHSNLYSARYEACKAQLIADNNYKTQDQAFSCAKNSTVIHLLGTLLFREGSVLE